MATAPHERYGSCRLCLRSPVPRQDSHLIPQWSYKRVRAPGSAKPDPVIIDDGEAHQTSRQFKELMLCRACEQRFGADEDYVSRLAYQIDGTVPLLQELIPSEPSEDGLIVAKPAPSLEVARIVRFASICLWRCHSSSKTPGCTLGEKYGEAFRRFLTGETHFPDEATLTLIVVHNTKLKDLPRTGLLFTTPQTFRDDGYHRHKLLLCNLHFEFAVGSQVSTLFREFCIVRGSPQYIVISPPDHLADWLRGTLHPAARNARKRRQRETAS